MYVRGTVNELSRDTIQIGDVVHGSSYENGADFTATVTEISVYPTTGDDSFGWGWGMSSEHTNASYYPFTAYIEDAQDVVEGSVEMSFAREESSASIYLENYFIRTDTNGKNYVMVQGADGLLEKRIVKTGKSVWGYYMEVISGISEADKIAFPYGKDVEEGAKTVEVDMLESSMGPY